MLSLKLLFMEDQAQKCPIFFYPGLQSPVYEKTGTTATVELLVHPSRYSTKGGRVDWVWWRNCSSDRQSA